MPVAINVHKHEYYRIRHDKTPSPRTTISGIIRGILSIYSRIIFLYPNYPIRHHPINPKNMDLKNLEVSHGGPWWPRVFLHPLPLRSSDSAGLWRPGMPARWLRAWRPCFISWTAALKASIGVRETQDLRRVLWTQFWMQHKNSITII